MLEFVSADLSELSYAREKMRYEGIVGSDRVFGTFFLWNDSYKSKIANYCSYPIIRYGRKDFHYYVPLRTDKTKEMFEALIEFSNKENVNFSFGSIYEEDLEYIENLFPNKFEFIENRNYFDYIYKTENLALLAGRKYHSKRNHITNFKKMYSYEYIPLTKENVSICIDIMDEWSSQREDPSEFDGEKIAIKRAVEYFDELSLFGGYIKIDGKPCAFTIAEEVNEKLADAHFEKALAGYDGLYAVINNEFAKSVLNKYEYINREEDMGIEGLRKAKLSYYPDILLKKYNLKLK